MDLYQFQSSKLNELKSVPFKLEKDIQSLIEDNINTVFGLELVKSEFQLNGLRIDTLGFDQSSRSFVIIEYKKSKNYSVIDQGYSYLSLLLNNKADFILEYLEATSRSLKKNDVDWSQSRVLFISPQFTTYQKHSVEFKDLPFELWEIKKYSNGTIGLDRYKPSSTQSVNDIKSADNIAEQVSKEIVVYTEDDHLSKGTDSTRELYYELRDRILELGDIELVPVKQYIGFKLGKRVVADLELQRKQLKVRVNLKKGELDDPKGIFRDVSKIGHWGIGDYEAAIDENDDLDYLMSLIKQSYSFHRK